MGYRVARAGAGCERRYRAQYRQGDRAVVALAEACFWYAVITTNYLGNVLENSLWTVAFVLVAIAVPDLLNRYRGAVKLSLMAAAVGVAGYVAFMCTVDVPMYFVRWQAELAAGRQFFGLWSGLHDVATRWVVTHDIARWDGEIAWMSLYFSAAVWTSLLLASFGLVKHLLPRYRLRSADVQVDPPEVRGAGPLSTAATGCALALICYFFCSSSRCFISLSSSSLCCAIRSAFRLSSSAPERAAACSISWRILSRTMRMR
jgi:hypothetical protein